MQLTVARGSMVLHHDPVQCNDPIAIGGYGKVHGVGFSLLRQTRAASIAEVTAVAKDRFVGSLTLVSRSRALALEPIAQWQTAAERPEF
jgi:hypothetical protein